MESCPRQEWIAHTPREPNVRTSHVKFRRSDLRFRVNRIVLDRAPVTSGLPRIADILRGGAVGMSQTCHEETSRVRVAQKKKPPEGGPLKGFLCSLLQSYRPGERAVAAVSLDHVVS